MKKDKMYAAAHGALSELLKVSPQDKILIISDENSADISDAFTGAAESFRCNVVSFTINEKERPLTEIPSGLPELLKDKTIVFNILKAYPEEISFRINWIFKIEENKNIRCAHMPGITTEMMTEGPMHIDYKTMQRKGISLIGEFKNADYLHITTKAGTDLKLGIKGRAFTTDVIPEPGKIFNLPCGEIYCAPEETRADGVIVFDASIGDIGILKKPLKVFVRNGKITKFESDDMSLVDRITELSSIDEEAGIVGELGIGINPGARITGSMLEDEKATGTAHIAFGNNADFPGGGHNHSKIHRDFLFYSPTIKIFCNDKSEKVFMDEGKFRTAG